MVIYFNPVISSFCSSLYSGKHKVKKRNSIPTRMSRRVWMLLFIAFLNVNRLHLVHGCAPLSLISRILQETSASTTHCGGLFYGFRTIFSFQFFYPLHSLIKRGSLSGNQLLQLIIFFFVSFLLFFVSFLLFFQGSRLCIYRCLQDVYKRQIWNRIPDTASRQAG